MQRAHADTTQLEWISEPSTEAWVPKGHQQVFFVALALHFEALACCHKPQDCSPNLQIFVNL